MLRTPKTSSKVDLEDEICHLQIELLEEAQHNKLLMEHLFFSLQNISGKKKSLQQKFIIECYILLIRCQHSNAT
jgi:hypothetical protein